MSIHEGKVKSSWPRPQIALLQLKLLFCYVGTLVAKLNTKYEFDQTNSLLYTAV